MSSELERHNMAQARQAVEQRFPQPPWLTAAGQEDRRAEQSHALAMREVARQMERHAAMAYAQLAEDLVEMEVDSRKLSESKWSITRAQKESEVLGNGDAELSAKFSILDDDFFQRRRAQLLDGLR